MDRHNFALISRDIVIVLRRMSNPKAASPTRQVRLSDLATDVGVSRAAVARVLLGTGAGQVRVADATARRIRAAARRRGYRPNRLAQQLKGLRSGMIGVLLDTDNPEVMHDRLYALEAEAERLGHRLLIGRVRGRPAAVERYIEDFEGRNTDGILCLFDLTADRATVLRRLARRTLNLVFHGRPPVRGAAFVRVDTNAAVHLLYDHLRTRGCRRIGLALRDPADALSRRRLQGYLSALRQHGEHRRARLIWTGNRRDPVQRMAFAAAGKLAGRGGADAIIASDDIFAVALIAELKRRGLDVPRDVAVTGYDNLSIGRVIEPPLTTIDQQHAAYAAAAFGLLLGTDRGGDGRATRGMVIAPKLVVRESS
jgi:DNA-binding LacI/PurR family transcriptional regulator